MENTAVYLNNVTKKFGDFVAVDNIDLPIVDGEFFSLLGPSGCGKTTTLRMVAGFEQPTQGELYLMGQPVAGIPPHRRPVNTVFQNYALFPHMTVWQNIAFGLEMAKVNNSEISQRVDSAIKRVHMEKFAQRKPKQLSGGQQQRVALARALVNRPKVLLLDEPLGALDLKLRKAMQLELKEIQSEVGITFIYVTHDQEEALTMSDRIAVMDHGLVRQVGTPREIYEHPVNRYVADFIGETNFITGTVDSVGDIIEVDVNGNRVHGKSDMTVHNGQSVIIAIRPEKLSVYPHLQNEAIQALQQEPTNNVVDGTVTEVIYIGTDTRYRISLLGDQELVVREQNFGTDQKIRFAAGDQVYVHWPASNARVLTE